jgi:Tol biopolymer transport system component
MGEVYKARDTRLERAVAVKVLPPSLAGDPEFKARFEREAKSISALNHPHICTLHDVGESAGTSFLVMEYLDGETLAARIARGPLPVPETIELAGQIADALDKAHRQGIVHRDLKPANVFLVRGTGAGTTPVCKLLDFGLAKVGAAVGVGTIETKLVTTPPVATAQGPALTSQGSLLGTFQYMAPEQIEGQDADARTDIWAFGCLLYEMLTGKRAFEGKSQASLIATILERQPTPMAELQPMTPPALGRLVRTCLEKSPDNRFHTAHDLWLYLQWVEEGGSAAGLPAPVVAGRRRRDRMLFGSAALGLALIAALGAWALKPAPEVAAAVGRFTFGLPDGQNFTRTGRRSVAISPDGTKVAYIANNQIYLRRLNELEPQPIRGTDLDPLDLAFSPDGNDLVFFTSGVTGVGFENVTLRRIDVSGGKAITLCPAGAPYGVRWHPGRIVFSLGDKIQVVPDTGGIAPQTLVSAGDQAVRLLRPEFVGEDGTLLYTRRTTSAQIVVQPPGGEPRVIVEDGVDAHLVPSGHLVWMRESTLFAQHFDRRSLKLVGGPAPLVEGVRLAGASSAGQYGVSDTGTLVFLPGATESKTDLVWVDRAGRELPTGAPTQSYTYPRLSPDGSKIVANGTEGDVDVWIWDIKRRTPTKLTSGPDSDQYAVWTPDSLSVIFRSAPVGGAQSDLFLRNADGTGSLVRLTDTKTSETPFMVMRDGRVLIRQADVDITTDGQLMLLPMKPGATAERLMPTTIPPQSNSEISPDGRWVAYQSREGSTAAEIHVRPFPATDSGHWQISSGGGQRPMWSRSGRELFYVSFNPTRIMSVAVPPTPAGGAFAPGPSATVLNTEKYSLGVLGRAFDISIDDKQFLMVKPVGAEASTRQTVTVVTNWFEELKARVK